MNKQEILKQYQKSEDKLLVAKILDKMQYTLTRNQIQHTDFLDGYQQKIANKTLQQMKYQNAIIYGGYEEAERKMQIFIPDKLQSLQDNQLQQSAIIQEIMKVISIILPRELREKYHHRDYLSALMKLGVKREKIGDILVMENGADIIVQNDIVDYLLTNLPQLTRFQMAEVIIKDISNLNTTTVKKEELTILVSQLRLDAIVTELIHGSRTKANDLITSERIYVNYELKTKNSTMLKQGDLLTIRGKGKFQIGEIIGQTSKGNIKVKIEKYIS